MLTVEPTTAAARRQYPSVSLLAPIKGVSSWQQRLRALQRDATERLRAELGDGAEAVLSVLDTAVSTATAPAGARSVAVYANEAGSEVVGLGVAVRERVVIDETFATRDLVHHELRSRSYWLLALTLDEPRLLRGHGERLVPDLLPARPLVEHPSAGRQQRRDRTDVLDASRVRRLRALDSALGEALGRSSDPLVVVGAEPTLSKFLSLTKHANRIEAVVRRAPDRQLSSLSRAIAPATAAALDERRRLALSELERAVGDGNASSGLHQVWREVHRRRPALLLVEAGLEQPAIIDPDGALAVTEDATAPGVVDDIVDEIIELVLAGGGRVEIATDGTLALHQGIALVPAAGRHR